MHNYIIMIFYIIYTFFRVFHNYVSKNAFARRAIFSFFVTNHYN